MSSDPSKLSYEDAAARLGITVDELKELRTDGRIRDYPDYGNWTFKADEVDALAEELGVAPAEAPAEEPAEEPTSSYEPSSYEPSSYEPSSYEPSSYQPSSPYEPGSTDQDTPSSSPTDPDYQPGVVPRFESESEAEPAEDQLEGHVESDTPGSSDDRPSDPELQSEPDAKTEEPLTAPPETEATEAKPPAAPEPVAVAQPVTSAMTREELTGSSEPIASARVIESIAMAHGVTFDQAAQVVDGFWDFLLDPDHFEGGRRRRRMPHFGSFSLQHGDDGRTALRFLSRPVQELQAHLASRGPSRPSETWIDHWERRDGGDATKLSLKRRIAVSIAARSELDTRTVFRLLWDLIETVTAIIASGQAPIRWAKRGEMALVTSGESPRYSFRTYSRLADILPPVSTPRPRQRRSGSMTITEFEEPGGRKRSRSRARRRQGAGISANKTGCGCLLVWLLVVGASVWIQGGFTDNNDNMHMHMHMNMDTAKETVHDEGATTVEMFPASKGSTGEQPFNPQGHDTRPGSTGRSPQRR